MTLISLRYSTFMSIHELSKRSSYHDNMKSISNCVLNQMPFIIKRSSKKKLKKNARSTNTALFALQRVHHTLDKLEQGTFPYYAHLSSLSSLSFLHGTCLTTWSLDKVNMTRCCRLMRKIREIYTATALAYSGSLL